MMGDFNSIWCVSEAFGGNPRSSEMIEFDDFCNHTVLVELGV